MSSAVRVQVDLEVSSWIEGRGVRHTNWRVRVNDAWIPIKELRDIQKTATDPDLTFYDDEVDEKRVLPPGCQYRITYHPRLPVGTRVERRISVPLVQPPIHKRAPESVEAAFQRLMAAGAGPKQPLQTSFAEFRVTKRGLITEAQWQARQQRANATGAPQAGMPVAPNRTISSTSDSEALSPTEVEAFARLLAKVG